MFKMELLKKYANLILQLRTLDITRDKNMLLWGMPLCIIFVILTIYIIRKRKLQYLSKCLEKTRLSLQTDDSSGRFRKRDKVLFYGRKMLRKVKIISGHVRGGQGKKRKLVLKLARKLLRMKDNFRPRLKTMEPPEEYLREDVYSKEDQRVPPDAFYMLQSIRIFGHFERPIFLNLCKHTELINVPAGSYLFKIGDPDEDVYIVQSGKLTVFATNDQGVVISLKVVNTGESLISLLSFTDVLTGHQRPFKTVCARALENSVVVKLPVKAFQQVFQEYPDTFIRVMQVIMVRLQRVTFTALNQYLGLATELVNQVLPKKNPVLHRSKELVSNEPSISSYYPTQDSGDVDCSLHQPEFVDIPNLLPNVSAHKCNQSVYHRRTRSAVEAKNHSDFINHVDYGGPVVNTMISNDGSNIHYVRKKSTVVDHSVSKTELIQMATETFIRELGLMDDALVKGKIEAWEITAGTYIMQEDSHQRAALACLMTGALSVHQRNAGDDETEEEVYLYTVYPGEIVGGLSVLTAELSFHSIKARQTSWIALLSKDSVYTMLRERPQTVLHIADTVVRRLSSFVRQVDFALDWQFIDSGRAVYRQDDESDSTYIVLSGRLRSVITHPDGKKELVAEYGKGDLVGIVEMVTHTRRSTTVMAIRDSELAKLPEGLFNAIKLRYPIVVTRLINLLGHRILGSWKKPGVTGKVEINRGQGNLSTVAVVPISDDVPITCFTYELFNSLSTIGSTLRLTSEIVKKALGQSIMDASNEYRLTSWLAQQEDQYRITLYQCDQSMTEWTQRCVRQADCILIVALGKNSPNVTTIEKQVGKLAIRTQKELVLLHQEETVLPQDTVAWLNMRTWISYHHHIKCVKHVFTTKSQYRINKLYNKEGTHQNVNVHSDFSRLARWLTGTSVGLVLGGGGARGAAHIGMLKAIQEVGIPIDMVGGVSIGAFMGGLWCIHRNTALMTQKAREWSKKMTHWWRQLWDLTYPVTSMFTGKHFNNTIRSTFHQVQIEDLWIPYFAITTDISASEMRVHTDGSLWQYVRASMSLSGYMPPLCDPRDGHLLLDGGYVNNLPADVMHSRGAKYILAVDVGSQDETDLTNYGDSLSGWWLLWKRYNPFTTPVKVPILPDIQSRLAYVSCVRQLEEVKNSDYCEYIRPPIDVFRTLQFSSFDEIREVGYNHGKIYLTGLLKSGSLTWTKSDSLRSSKHSINKAGSRYSYTFTDLAQMVCKVQPQTYMDDSSSSGSEYEMDEDAHEGGYASEPSSNILQMNHTHKTISCTHSLSENEMEYDESSLATYG